ncbi:MAG: hypothetical protein M4D80_15945 [Myxococcota bacterium]|nr:hypothetical protein [Deltaproteobacteria bacterium]MDQ3336660.1 hypothetical protein [Myxococcota bacterium]
MQNATPALQLAGCGPICCAWCAARDVLIRVRVKFATLALLVALATPVHGGERTHVAVLEFDGPGGTNVRGDVVRIAASRVWVSSDSKLDGRTVRELASDLDVEMVVQGHVEKHGRNYRIQIRFVHAMTGQTIARTISIGREPKLDPKARKRLERDLARALATIPTRPDDDDSPTAHADVPESR